MPIENYGITFFLNSPLKKNQAQLKVNFIIVIGMVAHIVMKEGVY